MSAVERGQMWCKLAVAIADGLPAPRDVNFYKPFASYDGEIIHMLEIILDGAAALWRWADAAGAKLADPEFSEHSKSWRQVAESRDWHGYDVTFKTYDASAPLPCGGMAAVRALAASIPVGGGEAAGLVGPAAAPAESSPAGPAVPADDPPAGAVSGVSRPLDRSGVAADSAPVATGDGAAVTPDVWVARRRNGIHFHQTNGQWGEHYTGCGRAARPNGTLLPQAEAEAFGAVPCPRCFGGSS